MGRVCVLCAKERPHENFGGGNGRRARICRKCRQMPRDKQDALLHECEIRGFLEQSHISAKNIARLQTLMRSKNAKIAELASLVSDIARLTPHRRRRIKTLARTSRDVLQRMENTGLIGPRLARDDVDQYDVDPVAAWYECVDEHEFPSTHESPTDAPYP